MSAPRPRSAQRMRQTEAARYLDRAAQLRSRRTLHPARWLRKPDRTARCATLPAGWLRSLRLAQRTSAPPILLQGDLRLLLVTVKILEREAHVFRHAQQQCDNALVLRPGFAHEEEQHADAGPALNQRSGHAGDRAGIDVGLLPDRSLCTTGEVLLDDRFLRPEHLAGDAHAVRVLRIGRIARLSDQIEILPGRGHWRQPMGIRLAQQNKSSERLATIHSSVAHPLKQVQFGAGVKDCFVRSAKRAEHAIEPPYCPLAIQARSLSREALQRMR